MATYLLYVRYERPTFGRVQQYRRSSSWFFLLLPAFTTSSSSSATAPVVDQRKHFSRTIRARPVKKGFPACRFFLLLVVVVVVVVGYLRAEFLHNTHFNIFNIYTHTQTRKWDTNADTGTRGGETFIFPCLPSSLLYFSSLSHFSGMSAFFACFKFSDSIYWLRLCFLLLLCLLFFFFFHHCRRWCPGLLVEAFFCGKLRLNGSRPERQKGRSNGRGRRTHLEEKKEEKKEVE